MHIQIYNWSIENNGILFGALLIPYEKITYIRYDNNRVYVYYENKISKLTYLEGKKQSLIEGLDYIEHVKKVKCEKFIKEKYDAGLYLKDGTEITQNDRDKHVKEMLEKKGLIYQLNGARGRHMDVYDDKCIISVKASFGSLLSGNSTDGEKTIYYVDCIGVQFKEPGITLGYIQLETASGLMNNRYSNFFNENSFTFEESQLDKAKMYEVYHYIKARIDEIKSGKARTSIEFSNQNNVDPIEEIKRYKELLEMGIITDDEFNKKKQELLNL